MKIFYLVIAFLIFASQSHCNEPQQEVTKNSSSISQLIKAIEEQDIKTLERELKERSFADQEKYLLISKALEQFKEYEQKAWLSLETKKGVFATSCVALIGMGLMCLGNLSCLALIYDVKPGVKVSFFKELKSLAPVDKKYLGLSLLGGLTCIAGAIFSLYASEYYAHRPLYILNLINQYTSPYKAFIDPISEKMMLCFNNIVIN